MTGIIRGKFEPQMGSIGIDYGSHIFEDPSATIFHEQAHYYLSSFTNYGAVFNTLSAITARKYNLVVDLKLIDTARTKLHNSMYFVQEGFAHILQAKKIQEDLGDDEVKRLERSIPARAQVALSDLLFILKLSPENFTKFTKKISLAAMHTDLHEKVIQNPSFILSAQMLATYLEDENNSPDARLKKLRYAIEKKPSLLDLDIQGICEAVGLSYIPPMSNKQKADLVNTVTAMTSTPTNLAESDIKTLETTTDIFLPSYETMVIHDTNIVSQARINVLPDVILKNLAKLRTIFVYNNPESPQPDGHFGYYAFLAPRIIVNSSMPIVGSENIFLPTTKTTKIVDTHSYDFKEVHLKIERDFVKPNIIWYKSIEDFKVFIEMVKEKTLSVSYRSFAFTEDSFHHFFLFRIEGEADLLHILPSMPLMHGRLVELNWQDAQLSELIGSDAQHINNFMHDLMGMPYPLNVTDLIEDPKKSLDTTKARMDAGLGVNDLCICGSAKKWKHCHGFDRK